MNQMDFDNYTLQQALCFLLLVPNSSCLPAYVGENVSTPTPDVIHVLENTTAWFNFTHIPLDDATVQWNFISTTGRPKNLIGYADGILHLDSRWIGRIGYIRSNGSGNIFLNNVGSRDEGRYDLQISHHGVNNTRSVTLRVVPLSKIGVRVSIDGVRYDITMADNGTNVTLPDDRALLDPKVKLERLDNMPWIISGYQVLVNKRDVEFLTNCGSMTCNNRREPSTEVIIEVTFDIQNVDNIRITKPMHVEAQWKSPPGHIKVLAGTTATFNWTHDTDNAAVEWFYEGTRRKEAYKSIMRFQDNQLYIMKTGISYLRLGYDEFPGSAHLKLRNVRTDDEGLYKVKVVDTQSTSTDGISDVAELSVIDVSELKLIVKVDSTLYEFSVMSNGTDVILPDVYFTHGSGLTLLIQVGDTAPIAHAIRVFSWNLDGRYNWMECDLSRYCAGSIPAFYLTNNDVAQINVVIDFDVQNLAVLSLGFTAKLIPEYDGTVFTSWARPRKIVYSWSFISVSVSIVMLCFIAYSCFKKDKSDQTCMAGCGKQAREYDTLNDDMKEQF